MEPTVLQILIKKDTKHFAQPEKLKAKTVYTVKPQWLEHGWLVYRGWFELFFQSLQNSSNSSRKQIVNDFYLFYYEIVCCVYSLESPHRGDSNEYTQHTIIV